jgi:RHS repeat-associated protein
MKGLTRYFGDWNVIDSLKYNNYVGNQLGRVDDAAGPNLPVGFQDKTSGTGYDYTYDVNGNTISDYNKSISTITYNYLNLPNVVTMTAKGTITYSYDAAGNKLQKKIVDQTVSPNKTTTYTYAGDYVYRNGGTVDTLEFVSMPEGRLRPVRIDTTQAISMTNLKYIYDYFLKDHLGSTRAVLTTEQQTDLYAATMETANATKENALFNNISSTATAVPPGFTNDPNNKMVSRLDGNINSGGNKRVGPSIILKVMTGDTISISVNSWYTGPVQPAATGVSLIATDLLPLLTNGITGANGSKGGAIPSSFTGPYMSQDITTMVQTDSVNYSPSLPKAFLNWMVVGEDYIAATSSPNHVKAIQIPACTGTDTAKQIVGLNQLVIRRNGWIYIYVSNESNQYVYFDNLVINLKHGPLVEQKAYFPFGMDNPALSSQAIKYQYKNNRYSFNGKEFQSIEFSDSSGLNEYDYGARYYDPQIGRWNVQDPLSEKSRRWSTYNYAFDNPIRFIDPDGMFAMPNYKSSKSSNEDENAIVDGDYYDDKGKKVGTDGINDNKKYVVQNKDDVNAVKRNDKAGGTTQVSDVKSAVELPSDKALNEALEVIKRTRLNGGLQEESSLVMKNGFVNHGPTGSLPSIDKNNVLTSNDNLPTILGNDKTTDVEVSIHSHLVLPYIAGNMFWWPSASTPSDTDMTTFKQFNRNIIVGNISVSNTYSVVNGSTFISPTPQFGIVIYDNQAKALLTLTENAVKNILK